MIYTGTVRFRFPAGGKYPSAAEVPVNQLPDGILSIVNVAYPHSLQAAKIVLAPPGPNTRRSLIDVQIVQSPAADPSSSPTGTAGVRFCRWLDAFPNGAFNPNFANTDCDKFQVSIAGEIPGLTKISISSTELNGAMIDGEFDNKTTDGGYYVDMKPDFGGQVSESILLVSDGDDDKYYSGPDGSDDGNHDQTLLGDFGSKIVVELPEFDFQKFYFDVQRPVGKVTLNAFYCSPAGDVPAEKRDLIIKQVRKMREIYRQLGIKVDLAALNGLQVNQGWFDPQGTTENPEQFERRNYLNEAECVQLRALIRANTVPEHQIRIGFVDAELHPELFELSNARGWTTLGDDGITISIYHRGTPFINNDETLGVTSHEVCHTLGEDHVSSALTYMLMKDSGIQWANKTSDSKRFSSVEETRMKSSTTYYVPLH